MKSIENSYQRSSWLKKTYSHNLLIKMFLRSNFIKWNEFSSSNKLDNKLNKPFFVNVNTIIYIRFSYIICEDLLDSLQNVIRERRNFWLPINETTIRRGHHFMIKEKQKYSLNLVFYLTLSLNHEWAKA